MIYSKPLFLCDWSAYLRSDGSYDLKAAYTDLFGESYYANHYLSLVEDIMRLRDAGAATVALATAHAIRTAKAP